MSMDKEQQPESEGRGGEKGKRRQNSRRKILDAARQMFVERGYHDTRPQDISRAAGVGHGTFYLHFTDKRECFAAFVEEAQVGLQKEVDKWTAEAGNMEEHLRGVLKGILTFSKENPRVLTAAVTDPGLIGQLRPGPMNGLTVWPLIGIVAAYTRTMIFRLLGIQLWVLRFSPAAMRSTADATPTKFSTALRIS